MTENEMTVLLAAVRNTIEQLGDAPAVVGWQSAYTDHGVFYTTFVAGYETEGGTYPAPETRGDLTAQADRMVEAAQALVEQRRGVFPDRPVRIVWRRPPEIQSSQEIRPSEDREYLYCRLAVEYVARGEDEFTDDAKVKASHNPARDRTLSTPIGDLTPGEPLLQFFDYLHLPPHLQDVSQPFAVLADTVVRTLPRNAERTTALRKLLEAKDCAVRAAVMR